MSRKAPRVLGSVLILSFLLTAVSCGNLTKTELKDCPIFHETEFGAVAIDISIEDFKALGFDFGDSLEIGFSNGKKEKDIPFYNGYYVRPGDFLLVGYPGYETIRFCCNSGDDPWITLGLKESDTVTIRLKEKEKFLSVQNALNSEFANYREVAGGNIKPATIYRGASPVDNKHKRAGYVDSLIKQDRINYVINLAETEEKLEELAKDTDYFKTIYDQGRYHLAVMNMNYKSDEFAKKVKDILIAMTANDGPYYIHCQEGKDRTGFVCLIVEALAGASYEEVKDDYMITYANYYKVTQEKDKTKYDMIVDQYLGGMIEAIAGKEITDPKATDLEEGARRYLKVAGMTDDEINSFVAKVTE